MCGADGQGNLSAVQCGCARDKGGHAPLWRHQSVPEKSGNEFKISASVHILSQNSAVKSSKNSVTLIDFFVPMLPSKP